MRKDTSKVPLDAANAAHQQGILLAFFTAFGIGILVCVVLGLHIPLLFGVAVGLMVLVVTYNGTPYQTRWNPGQRIGYVVRTDNECGTPNVIWTTHKELLTQTYRLRMRWFAVSGLVTASIVSVVRIIRYRYFGL